MKTIYKYKLEIIDHQTVMMPIGAIILSANVQYKNICIWAVVDTDKIEEPREIIIRGTGHPMLIRNYKFIDTLFINNGKLVFHVFEALGK